MSTQVYRHDLTGKLEAALRSSNAQVPTLPTRRSQPRPTPSCRMVTAVLRSWYSSSRSTS